ncbi:MAG TPA: hypothetical protein PKA64_01035, partial [Myxococcota bacterium]|nr:hypothetical protein [Myxococcota bacterium]
ATLRLVLDVAGRQEAFAPNLVLPPTMLDDLASDPPTSRAALRQRIGPWRDAMAGRWVDAALNGKLTVNVDRGSTSILVDENS